MARGPVYRGQVRATVDHLALNRKKTAEAVLEELLQLFPEACKDLHVRTVARWLQAARGEPGQPWSSVGSGGTPDDIAAVLGVLDALMEADPAAAITEAEAAAIMVIRRAVPLMPAAVVYRFAQDYANAGDDVAHLDVSLAYARRVQSRPGGGYHMDPASIAAHVKRHIDQWITRPLTFWAGSEAGGAAYVLALGDHASAVTRGGRWHYLDQDSDHGFTWYDSSGFGRLVIDTGKGPLS